VWVLAVKCTAKGGCADVTQIQRMLMSVLALLCKTVHALCMNMYCGEPGDTSLGESCSRFSFHETETGSN
jgi:hypothetical protein